MVRKAKDGAHNCKFSVELVWQSQDWHLRKNAKCGLEFKTPSDFLLLNI
jgi:hypothetical protein